MRYSKTHVNEIVNAIIKAVNDRYAESDQDAELDHAIELIREENLLVDRRLSSIPEYRSDIVRDFLDLKYSYKELMKKYHCSMRTVKSLLIQCAEDDMRVFNEIEFRSH